MFRKLLSAFCVYKSVRTDVPKTKFQLKELVTATREILWELPLPFVVLGGIYSGYFAVSEAAAITAVYVLFAEVVIYRDIHIRELPEIMKKSMLLVGGFCQGQHRKPDYFPGGAQHFPAGGRVYHGHIFRSGGRGPASRTNCQGLWN
jgi:hypothetical protein